MTKLLVCLAVAVLAAGVVALLGWIDHRYPKERARRAAGAAPRIRLPEDDSPWQ